ncbi:MAG: hypothetical protein JNK43_12110 [Ignavibacteria bacterium]|nr:hypothetical protein [Ignavibacteria bacterium]
MKRSLIYIFLFVMSVSMIGCLTVETKEYSFKLKDGNSGSGKIKYINIMHTMDSASTVEAEYEDLMTNYLNGKKPEDEMPGVKNVKKRLFEEDNQLCGEITFDFDDIRTLKFYNYKDKVWAYSLAGGSLFGGSEAYFSSNGTFGGESMNVVFWDGSENEFKLKTTVASNDKKNESLLDIWKKKSGK